MTELINDWKVCPMMTKPTGDLRYPYSGVVYCNDGYITIGTVNIGTDGLVYIHPDRPVVKCQAWSENRGCAICKQELGI